MWSILYKKKKIILWSTDGGKLMLFWHVTPPIYQDVMILDQSVFMGVADIYDRYRDMRLDVDNMSYEVKYKIKWTKFFLYQIMLVIILVPHHLFWMIGFLFYLNCLFILIMINLYLFNNFFTIFYFFIIFLFFHYLS